MYLLDTNVVSELRKVASGKADLQVAAWSKRVSEDALFISVITVQELEIGARLLLRRDEAQGTMLTEWIQSYVLPFFADRVLPVDLPVARASVGLHVPNPKPIRDGLIAATAQVHDLTVVTRNVRDFVECNVRLINPWLSRA
jgi:toxin FitB